MKQNTIPWLKRPDYILIIISLCSTAQFPNSPWPICENTFLLRILFTSLTMRGQKKHRRMASTVFQDPRCAPHAPPPGILPTVQSGVVLRIFLSYVCSPFSFEDSLVHVNTGVFFLCLLRQLLQEKDTELRIVFLLSSQFLPQHGKSTSPQCP